MESHFGHIIKCLNMCLQSPFSPVLLTHFTCLNHFHCHTLRYCNLEGWSSNFVSLQYSGYSTLFFSFLLLHSLFLQFPSRSPPIHCMLHLSHYPVFSPFPTPLSTSSMPSMVLFHFHVTYTRTHAHRCTLIHLYTHK